MTASGLTVDPALVAELSGKLSASVTHWALDTVEVSIFGDARGNWQLYDWPTDSPHHWRALLSSRIGPAGAHLHAIELREQGETGILAVMRVAQGQAALVLRAMQKRYPDLTFAL